VACSPRRVFAPAELVNGGQEKGRGKSGDCASAEGGFGWKEVPSFVVVAVVEAPGSVCLSTVLICARFNLREGP
jgi:hypothetical protein